MGEAYRTHEFTREMKSVYIIGRKIRKQDRNCYLGVLGID
jgi:hypothetical protein